MARKPKPETEPADFAAETVPLDSLRPHPRNYCRHPEDQLAHLAQSLREHGVYRNVVVARDGTILAGHGVVQAARMLGLDAIPVCRLALDPDEPRALKVLAGDNEIRHLAEADDRALSELLKQIKDEDPAGLLGTGYDEMMLANLVLVTRPESEVKDFDEAAEWVGMPEYDEGEKTLQLVVNFRSEADRDAFVERNDLVIDQSKGGKSTWWPPKDRQDLKSVLFEG